MRRLRRRLTDGFAIAGWGVVTIRNADGRIARQFEFTNLVTTIGDQHAAKRVAGISVTSPNGMKLGTGSTTPSKSGSGAALGTYESGTNVLFDSGFPTVTAMSGTDTGYLVTYQATWPSGTGPATGLQEVAMVTDAETNATSSAANTIARAALLVSGSPFDIDATQTITVTWRHKYLGA